MFEAKLDEAAFLKKLIDAIREVVTDCNFDCSADGISLQAVDSSHVSLVSLSLGRDAFSNYRCDKNLPLGTNLISLNKLLRAAKDDDVLTLSSKDDTSSLDLIFEDKSGRISEYTLTLIDMDQEYTDIPGTDYDATIEMSSAEFQRISRDLGNLSDTIKIEVKKNLVRFFSKGDIGSGNITISSSDSLDDPEESTKISCAKPIEMDFQLAYFQKFCRASSLSKTVKLQMTTEMPLLIEFPFPTGHLRYYIAPKFT